MVKMKGYTLYVLVIFVSFITGYGYRYNYNNRGIQNMIRLVYKPRADILIRAIREIIRALPAKEVTLVFDTFLNTDFQESLSQRLHETGIATKFYIVNDDESLERFCKDTKGVLAKYEEAVNLIFSTRTTFKQLMWTVLYDNIIQRKLLYVYYWGRHDVNQNIIKHFSEAMKIVIISNPRPGTYRIYYSQATSSGKSRLKMVNWWSVESGLYNKPLLPSAEKVYQDFKGRMFDVPVLHKPPWNFVEYNNDSILVDGGRDDKLLTVIAKKLNFRYEYFDPPDRIQGSSFTKNGTFPGVLGLVWDREVDFFLGDVTITFERSQAVEFSFLTLADSEAFVTHKPSKLNEAFALVRPFQTEVWPFIGVIFILYGPIIFGIIEAPYLWTKRRDETMSRMRKLRDCIWYSTGTFLRQGEKQPGTSHKARLVFIIVTLGATYVINDMYSANLTSLLARPGREPAITTLEQLETAMKTRGYQLLVEKHSSSYSVLKNGSEIYDRLWKKMQKQRRNVLESVEAGMKLVRDKKKFAFIGGRETLYFDTKRFGTHNFHLSEKLNTRYSGIAMQIGCPFLDNFNKIVMQLFEGGILTKMTEEEYERLGEKQRTAMGAGNSAEEIAAAKEEIEKHGESAVTYDDEEVQEGQGNAQQQAAENDHQLQPLSISMLQGAFYMLVIGYLAAALALILEINKRKIDKMFKYLGKKKKKMFSKVKCHPCLTIKKIMKWTRDRVVQCICNSLDSDSEPVHQYLE